MNETPGSTAPLPGPVDPRDLRVSDAEREHVVGLLQKAIGQGLITLDEFTTRTDTALAAKTRAELNAVLVDLPGMVHQQATSPRHQQPVELRATMSALKRVGRWDVPSTLLVRNRMGSVELDFTEARIDHAEVAVELDVAGGSVEIIVPDGASVSSGEVEVHAGSVKDRVGDGRVGRPHFVLSGLIRAGSLKVRRPTYVRIGALVIRFPWKVSWDRD
ncbi:MAG TPA: DUF1707 domain-containing protein [Actinophytocola sp.]|uniref:DUF1707 SHOCT-like domain-containing protein n=1 Tax=Actinophytocola sp. TaxID=1872138 RepID=UPI002DDCCB16|nr:DUF1707 domain-containing protein [Actinophytocola sp.]HEV2780310.1 DUF1707 domain-containing protein [Actinophytocola sp.]